MFREAGLLWQLVKPEMLEWWRRRGLWLAVVLGLVAVEINLRWPCWAYSRDETLSLFVAAKALYAARMFVLAALSLLAADQCESILIKASHNGAPLQVTCRSRFLLYLIQLSIPAAVFALGEFAYYVSERYALHSFGSDALPLAGLDPHTVMRMLLWSLLTPWKLVLSVIWIYGMLAIAPRSVLITWTLPIASAAGRLLALPLQAATFGGDSHLPDSGPTPAILALDLWATITSLALLAACIESLRLRQKKVLVSVISVLAISVLLWDAALECATLWPSKAASAWAAFFSFCTALYGRFLLIDGLMDTDLGSSLRAQSILEVLGLLAVIAVIWWLLRPRPATAATASEV